LVMGQFTLWEMKVPRMKESGRKTKWPFDMWGKKPSLYYHLVNRYLLLYCQKKVNASIWIFHIFNVCENRETIQHLLCIRLFFLFFGWNITKGNTFYFLPKLPSKTFQKQVTKFGPLIILRCHHWFV
jgi:hypothetical protein